MSGLPNCILVGFNREVSDRHLVFPIRSDKLSMSALVTAPVHSRKTDFQQIDIVDTEVFGRTLLLDGHIQLTRFDEHAYHESLVQLPLLSIPEPKTALVIGGGDGGVIRELCKHPSITRIDMVEIDGGVVEACREHMPELSAGAFDDPRVHLHLEDAFPWVKKADTKYDIIVADSTDVYEEEEGELSAMLFTEEFYTDCKNLLTDRGVVVTQADNLVFCPYSLEEITSLFKKVFPKTGWYQAIVPSFGGFSGYVWGSKGGSLSPAWPGASIPLRYLNAATYGFAFQPLGF